MAGKLMFSDMDAIPVLLEILKDLFHERESKWPKGITVDLILPLQLLSLSDKP